MKPLNSAALLTALCLFASVIAWPLMFSTAGITYGTSCEPIPMLMLSGIGESMCVASLSLLMERSRIMAQLDAFTTWALSPYFL